MSHRDGGRVKLVDVARAANVSLATASRALNQPEIVREPIRRRVEEAVRLLGYSPDRMARALSSGRSHIVGAVVPTLGNAIFADGVEALQDRLAARGYTLLLANSQYDPRKEEQEIRAFLEHGVDGLVLVGDSFAPEVLPLVRQHGVPLVTTYVCTSGQGIPAVGIDNRQATRKMTRYLLELGHREFAIIANTALPNDRSKARLDGMVLALAEAGIRLPSDRIVEVALPSIAYGRRALSGLFATDPAITAVLCTNDAVAVGASSEARRMGLNVPRDLSIVGFDNIEIAAEGDPPLTTVNVPADEIGRIAADYLVSVVEGGQIPMSTRLDAPLIVRDSTDRVRSPT
ncbi:LacI family DNA-binding transcriptional regulator [Geminicoccus roseus]|uniref:LacI family DNA-binding transcriptional regulator n=1 Tax=Geminicoccus roseus TaxID=404900 RepID=UPI00040E9FD4|nr:LacI family DNA-binding transcriptional regulator [Geminicoccus roseus]